MGTDNIGSLPRCEPKPRVSRASSRASGVRLVRDSDADIFEVSPADGFYLKHRERNSLRQSLRGVGNAILVQGLLYPLHSVGGDVFRRDIPGLLPLGLSLGWSRPWTVSTNRCKLATK